jgi:hypothetical protein
VVVGRRGIAARNQDDFAVGTGDRVAEYVDGVSVLVTAFADIAVVAIGIVVIAIDRKQIRRRRCERDETAVGADDRVEAALFGATLMRRTRAPSMV